MSFYLSAQREDDVVAAYNEYQAYLQRNRERFPPAVYQLATADWYFDFSDHRCPHDAWLSSLTVSERQNDAGSETSICIALLGAYHDFNLEFHYSGVTKYSFTNTDSDGLGDWLYDEFRLDDSGGLVHEIEWACGVSWLIYAKDCEFKATATDSAG